MDGWPAFDAAVAAARAVLEAAAPDPAVAAEAEAYLARAAAASLADAFLAQHLTEGGLARILPVRGGGNPDYVMWRTPIDPARRYRLDARLNASDRLAVTLYARDARGLILAGHLGFPRASLGEAGTLSLDLAADAAGPRGLVIPPQAHLMIVRILHRDPQARPADLVLSGGMPQPVLPTPPEDALARAGQGLVAVVRQFVEWSQLIGAHPNRFILPPPPIAENVRGDPDTVYGLGYYQLAPGEWLELAIPEGPADYWSLHPYTHWLEMLGGGVHDRSAARDPDGIVRIRIGSAAPAGLSNRVDTQGRSRGVLLYRTIGSSGGPRLPEAALRCA